MGRPSYDYGYIFDVAKRNGFAGSKDSCRDRIRDYVKTGVMTGDAVKGFKITAVGIDRAKASVTNEAAAVVETATASN